MEGAMTTHTDLAAMTGAEVRSLVRAGGWRRPTAGLAAGWVQANLVVLPLRYINDFHLFCDRQPKACPLLQATSLGSPEPDLIAPGSDVRLDVPRYRVYRDGVLVEEVDNLLNLWQDDFVAFLLGCSFTFEAALQAAGVPLRHVELGSNVPMYRTNRETKPAGVFRGPLVVSMRPIPEALVERAVSITERFPKAHGGPVHIGDPATLGIADLSRPDYGDAVPVHPGEVPVFWACGVTPQAVAEAARIPLMITHAPGHMFLTDLRDEHLANPHSYWTTDQRRER
jgi:uncharacterized protein YcsI (UPF0317 family)